MRERIILAPGAKQSEIKKSLAVHGVNCINLKIMSSGELARYALMKSGVSIEEDFLSSKEECAIIARAVVGEEYFGKTSYSDIKQIASAVKLMRTLTTNYDEEAFLSDVLNYGLFKDKNTALLNVYKKYMAILKESNALDNVSLMRKAMKECKSFDADFECLSEYPLSPLERAFLSVISDGNIKEISIAALFGIENVFVKLENIKNCYGSPNEVETIINDIYKNRKLDTCTVALADSSTYAQLFFDYALLYDIPVTFGTGIPIINANPAKLLVLYYHWITDGFFGAFALNNMFSSKAFDKNKLYELFPEIPEDFSWGRFYEVLAGLRLTNDKKVNDLRLKAFKDALSEEEVITNPEDEKAYKDFSRKKLCVPFLEIMAEELILPTEDFIAKYSYIRKGTKTNAERLLMMLDMSASSAIYEELKVIRNAGIDQTTDDIILNVLKLGVGGQSSSEGALHVTDISGAISSVRDNLYIAGLSASKFPGSPIENYLLLDDDLTIFGKEAAYMKSAGKIAKKKDTLSNLVHLASGLGSHIFLSYAGMNVSELKRDNASSMIYELFKEESGKNLSSKELEEHIVKVEYFEPAISVSREVGNAYNQGKKVLIDKEASQSLGDSHFVKWNLDREYSPSALNTFFGCPRSFMLGYILGIPEPDDDKPFEIISAKAKGTLAHSLMEKLANSDMSQEDFVKLSGEYFDRFIVQNPPLIMESVEAVRNQFLEMMETAYEMDPHREVTLKEEDIHCQHESGVKIHGLPDRVERLEDGKYLIVDFKSGRHIVHVENDIDTCLQVVIYAYLMEKQGYDISGGVFRYIGLGESVSCVYNDEMKEKLNEKLKQFKDHMEKGYFPCAEASEDGENPCIYCKYGLVCGKN